MLGLLACLFSQTFIEKNPNLRSPVLGRGFPFPSLSISNQIGDPREKALHEALYRCLPRPQSDHRESLYGVVL